MKIPHFSGLCPPPPFKNSTYTVICYLPTLWVLVRERAPHEKISGGSQKYRKGVDHRKGGVPLERGGGCKVVPSYDNLKEIKSEELKMLPASSVFTRSFRYIQIVAKVILYSIPRLPATQQNTI